MLTSIAGVADTRLTSCRVTSFRRIRFGQTIPFIAIRKRRLTASPNTTAYARLRGRRGFRCEHSAILSHIIREVEGSDARADCLITTTLTNPVAATEICQLHWPWRTGV